MKKLFLLFLISPSIITAMDKKDGDQTQREPTTQATSNTNNSALIPGQLAPGEATIMLLFPLNWKDILGEKQPEKQEKSPSNQINNEKQQKSKKCCSSCWPCCWPCCRKKQ